VEGGTLDRRLSFNGGLVSDWHRSL
jgi:hypothetical protein